MKYLIVQCSELHDQYECDADRTPICLTDDCSQYGIGYEVYQVNSDGSFIKIKDYDESLENGLALYWWDGNDEIEEGTAPTVVKKWKGMTRDDVSKSFVKDLKALAGFDNTIKAILQNIDRSGSYGEMIGDRWVVFGEYDDNRFDSGY